MKDSVKATNKVNKKQETRKASNNLGSHCTQKKQNRKGENPVRLQSDPESSLNFESAKSWICKNSACRAVLSLDDSFCKRCSCCICHLFDDNKDPSLWLVCSSESSLDDSCGLSCHIECALQRGKVGVVSLGQLMQLDGSYCCASCGKVSGILGNWKKQLLVAKDARRVDVLCYRLYLSYRLLHGTSRFKELHEIVQEAKAKVETEVGPIDGVSAKMARGIVSRLSVANSVQELCSLAIDKAEEWLAVVSNGGAISRADSLPAACKFLFEEVTSSSVIIVLIELSTASSDDIKGYKLWCCKSEEEMHREEPICTFARDKRRIQISNLQPCTEYVFRIISYTDTGDFGHSETKCFTKSVEIVCGNPGSGSGMYSDKDNPHIEGKLQAKTEPKSAPSDNSPGFRVRDLGKILHITWIQRQGSFEGAFGIDADKCCGITKATEPEVVEQYQLPPVARDLDLNVASVPDLNEEFTPFESSRDEDNGCTLQQAVEAEDDAASRDVEKNNLGKLHRSSDSQTWICGPASREVPTVDSRVDLCKKRSASANEEAHDCDSILVNGSPSQISNSSGFLDENFEYCVKIIRWLECEGHINQEFRLKLLTWFSLRSTDQERRIVNTFIQTMIDDPGSLAGQLVDSFSDIISSKRPRNGYYNKSWHHTEVNSENQDC